MLGEKQEARDLARRWLWSLQLAVAGERLRWRLDTAGRAWVGFAGYWLCVVLGTIEVLPNCMGWGQAWGGL